MLRPCSRPMMHWGVGGRANRYDPRQLRAGRYEAHRVLVSPPDVFHQTETHFSFAKIFRVKNDTFENAEPIPTSIIRPGHHQPSGGSSAEAVHVIPPTRVRAASALAVPISFSIAKTLPKNCLFGFFFRPLFLPPTVHTSASCF